jgi:hypothetical protein
MECCVLKSHDLRGVLGVQIHAHVQKRSRRPSWRGLCVMLLPPPEMSMGQGRGEDANATTSGQEHKDVREHAHAPLRADAYFSHIFVLLRNLNLDEPDFNLSKKLRQVHDPFLHGHAGTETRTIET